MEFNHIRECVSKGKRLKISKTVGYSLATETMPNIYGKVRAYAMDRGGYNILDTLEHILLMYVTADGITIKGLKISGGKYYYTEWFCFKKG